MTDPQAIAIAAAAQRVIAACQAAGLRLAVGESCTGGMITAAITAQQGSSAVFDGGIIAYANEAKEGLLGVPKDTMIEHGSVSAEVAAVMAGAVREQLRADIGLGVTGVAGPGGGTPDKPVGRVYLHLSGPNGTEQARVFDFSGDREAVRTQTVAEALGLVLDALDPAAPPAVPPAAP